MSESNPPDSTSEEGARREDVFSIDAGAGTNVTQTMDGSIIFGDAIQIGRVGGNVTVARSALGYQVAAFPAPRSLPTAEQANAQPSRLLLAGYEIAPFIGRRALRSLLVAWLDGPVQPVDQGSRMSVRLVHGPGGQGKTRLAADLARHATGRAWQAHPALPTATAPTWLRRPAGAGNILVVVDYADRWPLEHLRALLTDLHNLVIQLPDGRGLRVLLLSRAAGGWWQGMVSFLDDRLHLDAEATALTSLGSEIDRRELFIAARDRFATVMGVPGCAQLLPPARLNDDRFAQVLTVHMAALAAVDAHARGNVPPTDPERISAYLLLRERRHWQEWSQRHDDPLPTRPQVMGHAVWAAITAGPLPYVDGVSVLAQTEIAVLAETADQVLTDHRRCYPPTDPATVLEPLYPDRLAEDFLALVTPGNTTPGADLSSVDPWADTALTKLLAPSPTGPPRWTRTALTVLIETAYRWPHIASTRLVPLMAAHPDLAAHAGGAALARLVSVPGIDPALLEHVDAELPPGRHVEFDLARAALSTALLERRLASAPGPAMRGALFSDHSVRLSHAGQYQAAVNAARQAVSLYTEATEIDRTNYQPGLALALNNLAASLAKAGRRDEAAPISCRVVDLYTELVEFDRTAYLPDLAMSLANYAMQLATTGQRDEATPISHRAVELYQELTQLNDAAYRPDLASSLANHALRLAEAGQRREAVFISQKAITLLRELIEEDRAVHLPDLASSLNNHGNLLVGIGLREEAVSISRQAVELYRELVQLNRAVYLPELATALSSYGIQLTQVGQRVEATTVSLEAVEIHREMAEHNRAAYLPDLAVSLVNHVARLSEVGRHNEAVVASQQAVDLYSELVQVNRAAYLPNLATSWHNHAASLAEVGRHNEAVVASQQAVDLSSELVQVNRAAYLPGLASSLSGHAVQLRNVGRHTEALLISKQAIKLYGKLSRLDPAAYVPDQAKALMNHAGFLGVAGRRSKAAGTSQRAVTMYSEMVKLNRAAYLPDLARSLSNHAAFLAQTGLRSRAVLAGQQSVELHRELMELNPSAYVQNYIQSLSTQGFALMAVRRYREAATALTEAQILCQELPGHAQSLRQAVVDLLRQAYSLSPTEVTAVFRRMTGQDAPIWLTQT
ncbi:tetratricopeptide repeat protein [Streptosporangiaceae bacterium NEAU-GS5]|nr:tetratricopeptide repeat protein [Streptosporangiaceae bacterium NEAU-GS5]